MQYLVNLFSPLELLEFLEANEQPRPTTIRLNPLKTTRKKLIQILLNKKIIPEAIDFCKLGLKISESKFSIGSTAEYLGGLYTI